MPQRKNVTEKDIKIELEKTTQLLRKIKGERINPGLPLHLAPKGKKKKKSKSKSRSKPRSKSKPKPRSKSKSRSKPKPRSKSKSRSKPKSKPKPKSKSKSKSKSKPKPKSSSKKKKLEKMGIEPRLLFGMDEDELGELLNNPQLMNSLGPYQGNFLPPDDDSTPPPGRYGFTGPALGYDYVPDADPMAADTLQRTTNKPIRQEVLPEVLRPRFG